MWRITFEVKDASSLKALMEFAAANNMTPGVLDINSQDAALAEKLASESWLVEAVHVQLKESELDRYFTIRDVRDRLRKSGVVSLESVTRLTFEAFLLREEWWFTKEILNAMADLGVTFADGANPAEFATYKMAHDEPTSRTAINLQASGVTSWAMFPYLSAKFFKGVRYVGNGSRLNSIRAVLKDRGLALKGE